MKNLPQGLKFLNKHLKMNKINFYEQNIETGLTISHSRSRKKNPSDFFKNLKISLKFLEKTKTALSLPELKKKNQNSLSFPEFPECVPTLLKTYSSYVNDKKV